MKRSIKSNQRQMRIMLFKVDGTGTAALSGPDQYGATLTDNGTGDYTITFDNDRVFSQVPLVFATPLTDNVVISQHSASTASAVRLECKGLGTSEKTASLTVDSAIKFHSQLNGADGNDITIELADAVSAGSEAVASVSDAGAIVINIEGGVSTATQVHAAIMDSDLDLADEARNFISCEILTGATAITAAAAANLAGGVDEAAAAAIDCDFDLMVIGSDVDENY